MHRLSVGRDAELRELIQPLEQLLLLAARHGVAGVDHVDKGRGARVVVDALQESLVGG